jgi:signal transduction histidine kinase
LSTKTNSKAKASAKAKAKKKIDVKGLRFRLILYFLIFTTLVISMIWFLQVFFLGNYYESMKLSESNSIAARIRQEYEESDTVFDLKDTINEITRNSDCFIRVETGDGILMLVTEYNNFKLPQIYSLQSGRMRYDLLNSDQQSISRIWTDKDSSKTLMYVTFLHKELEEDGSIDERNSMVLFMFSPLYPVRSTVSILQRQLIYVSVIAVIMAILVSIVLSSHISKPIRNITESAKEMGKGNYAVKFKSGSYTEMKELASTLSTTAQELERTDNYQKDLIANVSHDLKTPLTMIRSYAEMIRDISGNDPVKREKHLEVIIEEADRLNTLVNDMLNVSRMQQRRITLSRSDFDIGRLTEKLLESYDILAEQEGYTFYYEVPEEPLIVNADEEKIKQVISNLVNNAVKYCDEDKVIMIEVAKSGKNSVRCDVKDNGPGIPKDEINHVWERYYKSSAHHVRPTEGSGLGLAIVREILQLHKAEYGVESEPGEGSDFWFKLPLVNAKAQKR